MVPRLYNWKFDYDFINHDMEYLHKYLYVRKVNKIIDKMSRILTFQKKKLSQMECH